MLNDMDRYDLVMDVIDRARTRPAGGRAAPRDGRRAAAQGARTRASTATTRGHPGLGLAVPVVNAGSSSLKLRLVSLPYVAVSGVAEPLERGPFGLAAGVSEG